MTITTTAPQQQRKQRRPRNRKAKTDLSEVRNALCCFRINPTNQSTKNNNFPFFSPSDANANAMTDIDRRFPGAIMQLQVQVQGEGRRERERQH
ncbi:hypothetical protein VTN00DRAFT_671 [Thermoascus crustaceus]|uniref:uncharacterized protein n=1 Tax=Thermoascus crustaceus TaxID=5088 RepID=UPI003742E6D5